MIYCFGFRYFLTHEKNMIKPVVLVLVSDINECEYNTHNCSVNGLCINVNGSFNCSCSLGYKGDGWNCAGKVFLKTRNR